MGKIAIRKARSANMLDKQPLFKPSATVLQETPVRSEVNMLFKPSATVETAEYSVERRGCDTHTRLQSSTVEQQDSDVSHTSSADTDPGWGEAYVKPTKHNPSLHMLRDIVTKCKRKAATALDTNGSGDTSTDSEDMWGETHDPTLQGSEQLPVYHTLQVPLDTQPVCKPEFRVGKYTTFSKSELAALAPHLVNMWTHSRSHRGDALDTAVNTTMDKSPTCKPYQPVNYKLQWCNDCNIPPQVRKTLQANLRRKLRKPRTPNYTSHVKNKGL